MKAVDVRGPAGAQSSAARACFASCNATAASTWIPGMAAFGKVHAVQALPDACVVRIIARSAVKTYGFQRPDRDARDAACAGARRASFHRCRLCACRSDS